jgi:hypothetical protein
MPFAHGHFMWRQGDDGLLKLKRVVAPRAFTVHFRGVIHQVRAHRRVQAPAVH